METKIKEVFCKDNRIKEIEDTIFNLPVENCRESLFKYIMTETHKMENKFEKDYIYNLYHSIQDFIFNVNNEFVYKDMNRDELIRELNDNLIEGTYTIESMSCDNFDGVLDHYSDKQLYPFVKKFMFDNFNELLEKTELSKKEIEKKKLLESIKTIEDNIKYNKEVIEKDEKRLKEKKEELQKLK